MDKLDRLWVSLARSLHAETPESSTIIKVFAGTLDYVHRNNWQGACHATSVVMAMLFAYHKINCEPWLGECKIDDGYFDHSWVVISGLIYDVAISRPLIPELRAPPVFASKSLGISDELRIEYGAMSGSGFDEHATSILSMPISVFIEEYPNHKNGLWGVAKDIGGKAGLHINLRRMKDSCQSLTWKVAAS